MQYPPFQLHRALQPCPTAHRCTKTTDKETGKTRNNRKNIKDYRNCSRNSDSDFNCILKLCESKERKAEKSAEALEKLITVKTKNLTAGFFTFI